MKKSYWSACIAVAFASGIMVGLGGGLVAGYRIGHGPIAIAAPVEIPTRDEFRSRWMGKSKQEILNGLGKPTRTYSARSDSDSWIYRSIARDPISGKIEDPTIKFSTAGFVVEVIFF